MVGSAAGLAQKLNVKTSEAAATLTLVNAKTDVTLYTAQGAAQSKDLQMNQGGALGGLTRLAGGGNLSSVLGGGYGDSDTGKVVSAAYLQAFADLVRHVQSQPTAATTTGPSTAAGAGGHVAARAVVRARPAATAKIAFRLPAGGAVFPTGRRNGVWMEVDDAAGHRGWLQSTLVIP